MEKFKKLLEKNIVFLDGAMGTMLQDDSLPAGFLPEMLILDAPDRIAQIHKSYLEAGSDIIYANTFGANKYKIQNPEQIIKAAVRLAKDVAAPYGAAVALDVGSLGKMFLSFDELYAAFVPLVKAGEEAGADLVVFETMSDLAEMRAAVLAAKENTALPIMATMTFEKNGRSFSGCSATAFARTITGLGVDAIGLNCSLGPDEVLDTVRELRANTHLPLVVKPNAGLPDQDGNYNIGSCLFADMFDQIIEAGVKIVGGCCGSNPNFVKELKSKFANTTPPQIQQEKRNVVCSATKTVYLDGGFKIVGERLNPTGKKKLTEAIASGNVDYLLTQATEQSTDGADVLDVNVGVSGVDEAAVMKRVVNAVQGVTDLPLQIDSSDPKAIEAGLRAFNGVAIVNSVNGKESVLEDILPIAKKYGAYVIGLCLDEKGIPKSAEKRIEIAHRIMDAAAKYGIPKDKLIIDCLVLTVSAQQEQATETLAAIRTVREELGLLTLLGVSNISFGLPERPLINTTFLAMAVQAGLNLAILNPSATEVKRTTAAIRVLTGEDKNAEQYIELTAKTEEENIDDRLKAAVIKGLESEAASLTGEALKSESAESIIQNRLIPALDTVGEKFENGEFFLPRLISAANAAESAFGVIKEYYKSTGAKANDKGTIVICTVKGDIHDIGKNITKTLLENYGYYVVDLGKDVPVEEVVKATKESGARLVGLSALMTTTIKSMEETIKALREKTPDIKIMVGGAVITEEIAKNIGADFYSSDAKQAVDIARRVYG